MSAIIDVYVSLDNVYIYKAAEDKANSRGQWCLVGKPALLADGHAHTCRCLAARVQERSRR